MLEANIQKFLEEAGPIFYVTPTAARAIGLEKELPDFHIVAAQPSEDVELLRQAGVKVFCLGKDVRNAGKMLLEEEVIAYIKQNSTGKQANVMTFKSSPMIEMACARHGFRFLGNSSEFGREFEDKVKFAAFTDSLGVPNAHSRIVQVTSDSLDDLVRSFDFSGGKKYVLQLARGYSGNSTFVVNSPYALRQLLGENIGRKLKLSDFLTGDTYTFDVCVGDFGVRISRPIFQITGFIDFNRNPLGTCGNDYAYGRRLDAGKRQLAEQCIRPVSEALLARGYRGFLGFDLVVGENETALIEVNPRLVGSVPVFTKLQLFAGQTPFLLLHLLALLGFDFSSLSLPEEASDFEFSQLILRNTARETRRMYSALPSGIYRLGSDGITFCRSAYAADAELRTDEFFLGCAGAGTAIAPDMEYANLQLPYGIMETRQSFQPDFRRLPQAILSKLILKRA